MNINTHKETLHADGWPLMLASAPLSISRINGPHWASSSVGLEHQRKLIKITSALSPRLLDFFSLFSKNKTKDTICECFFVSSRSGSFCLLVGVDVIRFENLINPTACWHPGHGKVGCHDYKPDWERFEQRRVVDLSRHQKRSEPIFCCCKIHCWVVISDSSPNLLLVLFPWFVIWRSISDVPECYLTGIPLPLSPWWCKLAL